MLPRAYPGQECPLARALEVVGERWTLLVLRDAFRGVTRFDAFARSLGVAPNILAKRLGALVEAGVLERRRLQGRPERFAYVLTPAGGELLPALVDLMQWGAAHAAGDGPSARPRHAGCGGALGRGAVCARCGRAAGAGDVEWPPAAGAGGDGSAVAGGDGGDGAAGAAGPAPPPAAAAQPTRPSAAATARV